MKIQCDACAAAEAVVLCYADEAALCWACDAMVHAANTLVGNHKRFLLLSGEGGGGTAASTSSRVVKCDICKEAPAYFFCLEDRALLCLDCDVAVHTANKYVFVHQRFLLTGLQVGRQSIDQVSLTISQQLNAAAITKESPSLPLNQGLNTAGRAEETNSVPLFRGAGEWSSCQVGRDLNVRTDFHTGGGVASDWPLDNLFVFPDFNRDLGFNEQDSSKLFESGKFGCTHELEFCFPPAEVLNSEGCLNQLHELSWTVPESPPIPIESGLHLQGHQDNATAETSAFVPDIGYSSRPLTYFSPSFNSKLYSTN